MTRACRILLLFLISACLALPCHAAITTLDVSTLTYNSGVQISGDSKNFIILGDNPVGSTGSGNIQSFLRIDSGAGDISPPPSNEKGYNTDGALLMDQLGGGFTRSIKLGFVPKVNIGGVIY